MLKVLDLFSGIGGFSLGLERTGGFETVAFCEIEPFPRKVLAKHWPKVPQYEDVRELTKDILDRDGISVDVITGGFPCQDISVAGEQAGIEEGTRSGLWSEIIRLVGELRPQYVIVENVANLLSGPSDKRGGWFGRILADLAECGYDAEWENIPASAVGASHRRERVWIVGYPKKLVGNGCESLRESSCKVPVLREFGGTSVVNDVANANSERLQGGQETRDAGGSGTWGKQLFARCANLQRPVWGIEPAVGRVANGVPGRVDRLKGLGNAVVPQIPELIGNAILDSLGKTKDEDNG